MRIPGLAKLIKLLIQVCNVINFSQAIIRPFVPPEDQTAFDGACDAIRSACDVIRAIDYADSELGSNPLWGAK